MSFDKFINWMNSSLNGLGLLVDLLVVPARPFLFRTCHELDKNQSDNDLNKFLHNATTGKSIGLMSEAGCPGVADPGAKVVEAAHQMGIRVVPLIGPSSILLSLMASGMNGQSFAFLGYLPIKTKERIQSIRNVAGKCKHQTQIFIEAPYRNNQLLKDLIQYLPPNIKLCIACDLGSKDDEFIKSDFVKNWKGELPDLHKRPTVFVVGV